MSAGPGITSNDDWGEFSVLVEWSSGQANIHYAAREDLVQQMSKKSQRAINLAMGTIRSMSYKISRTIEDLEERIRPDTAEVEFGINLDAEAGAMLARASAGAQIKVTLNWSIDQPEKPKPLIKD